MSGFIGAAQPRNNIGEQDLRLSPPFHRLIGVLFAECLSAVYPPTFESEWWPGGGLLGDAGVDVGSAAHQDSWGYFNPAAGAASRYGFVGVTRDVYGTAVGSVTCKLFLTSDDSLQDTTTSNNTTGEFLLNTVYYPNAHYIVCHKGGSPDIDGVTQNTLIGT